MKTETEGLSREEFEKWAASKHLDLPRWDSGKYASPFTEMAWASWSAASSLKQAPTPEFEKWWVEDGKFYDPDTEDVPWYDKRRELAEYAWQAASLKQADPEYCHAQKDGDCDWAQCPQLKNYQDHCPLDISGKQAEPPSQPHGHLRENCLLCTSTCTHGDEQDYGTCPLLPHDPVAGSPSQASTQPKCNCGAGDDAYLACHADVCALKKWAAPRYEISQATKED